MLSSTVREFPGLSHQAFQHPLDSGSLAFLQQIPLLSQFSRKFSEVFTENRMRLHFVSSAARVSNKQYPKLYARYVRMARALDIQRLPDLYIQTADEFDAFAVGQERCSIVVYSGLIDLLSEDELLAVIGHELGHVKCGHMLYTTMAEMLRLFGFDLIELIGDLTLGLGKLASLPFQLALLDWSRKATFSCDRAALLATQNQQAVRGLLAKLGGYSHKLESEPNIDELRRQANEFEELGSDSTLTKMMRVFMMMRETHPYPVVRIEEISKWAESRDYQQILAGNYVGTKGLEKPPRFQSALSTPTGVFCVKCELGWPTGSLFCGKCGSSLDSAPTVCGVCINVIEPEWGACPSCGNRLA